MRVFVAGATGAIGRPLVARLLETGHEVWVLARSPERIPPDARAVLADALDRDAVVGAVTEARPDFERANPGFL